MQVGSSVNRGELKVNVDASVRIGEGSFAVGMVVRDHMGSFVQARVARRAGEVPIIEAEARGILEALMWIKDLNLGLKKVMLESDSQLAVTAIVQGTEYNFEVGNVLNDCRELLRNNSNVTIRFINEISSRFQKV